MSAKACTQFEDRIHELMDSRQPVSTDSHLKSHAITCVLCRALMDDYSTLDDLLSADLLSATTGTRSVQLRSNDQSGLNRNSDSMSGQNKTRSRKTAPRKHSESYRGINRFNAWTAVASMLLVALTAGLVWQGPRNADSGLTTASVELINDGNEAGTDSVLSNSIPTNDEPPQGSWTTGYASAGQGVAEIQSRAGTQSIAGISRASWSELPEELQPLNSYLRISSELPGVHPFRSSIDATFNFFYRSFQPRKSSDQRDPEQSRHRDSRSPLNRMICSIS